MRAWSALEGVPVYRPSASDADATAINREIRFSLQGPDAESFRIDPMTGSISLRAGIDYAPVQSYQVSLVAANTASPFGAAEQTLPITVRRVELQSLQSVTAGEVIGLAGKPVAQIETGASSDLSPRLSGPDAALFRIDPAGRLMFVPGATPLDPTERASYQVSVDLYGLADQDHPIASRPFALMVQKPERLDFRLTELAGDARLDGAEMRRYGDDPSLPVVAGQAPAGALVYLGWTDQDGQWIPDLRVVSTRANPQGQWAFSLAQLLGERDMGDITPLHDGRYRLRLIAVDEASRVIGQASAALEVAATPTFELELGNGRLHLGGTADGLVLVEVDAQGRAHLSRYGLYSAELAHSDQGVSDFFERRIDGVSALELHLAPPTDPAPRVYRLDVPGLTSLALSGASGPGQDRFILQVDDPQPSAFDVRLLHLDTLGLSARGDILRFEFEPSARNHPANPFDDDRLILTPASRISDDFSQIESVGGTVDPSAIDLLAGGYFPIDRPWSLDAGLGLRSLPPLTPSSSTPPAGI